MGLTQIDPPASLAELLLDSVLQQLNLTVDTGESPPPTVPDEALVLEYTKAAVAHLDGPSGRLGRCLLTQKWRLTVDHCWPPIIPLTLPPISAIDAVSYADEDGEEQTLGESAYRVTGLGTWLTEVAPAFGETWPAVRWQREAITIEFTTGYGTGLEDVPAPILQAIRMLAAHWYLNRSPLGSGSELPFGFRDLIAPFRVYRPFE